ncbi:unnamed protein product [Tilletia controversa]|uniref:RGS domain-containing protein n=3 Tax=Tilletia TaxID=13289 RepID=A0A8X7MTB6_9BASI|nr:hypothetical protein CF336_g4245 [Tilletia laevis]KAE8196648.1 hypothetical protein CF328_g4076 [Tilletia controversa]KAE8260692.1 hypothetical protein A4X03_0g3729 [Tilletia caries]KAE8202040.1 hypothetical protein CF335_g3566 [Tilletia laevis]KAE8247298.1 hypothetical protein A4X06_0g4555 [Tilletia controversa]
MSASDSSVHSHLPTRTRQQTSSRMMKTTRRGRPFAKDTHDLFATLIVSLQLTTHRQYFKSYPNSFTTDEAAENLSALKFSQSNRAPDPNEPSRVITTTTTTTFSMNREMAKGICQHFMDARLIENAADMSSAIFKERGVYMLTPKGLHILERFITKNGINGEHLLKVFSSQPICMKLLHLERRPSDDELLINTPVLYVIFRRFVGRAPNYPYGQGRIADTVSASGPVSPQGGAVGAGGGSAGAGGGASGNSLNSAQEFDRTLGVEMADLVEKPPKGSASKTAVLYRHTFTAIAALDWLCDFTTVCGRDEAAELAAHFVRLGLIELVIDRSRKDTDDRAVVVVQGEDAAVPGQWTEGELRCSHKAIYTVTPLGRAIARWEGYEALQPIYLAKFQANLAGGGGAGAGSPANAASSQGSPHLPQSANNAIVRQALHSGLGNVAGPSALRDSGEYTQARSASPSIASMVGTTTSALNPLRGEESLDNANLAGGGAGDAGGEASVDYETAVDGNMEHMRVTSASGRSLNQIRSNELKGSRSNIPSAGSDGRLPRTASNQADRLRSDYLAGQDHDSQGSSLSSSSTGLSAMMQNSGISANTMHAHAIALAIANEQSSYNQRDSNTNRLKQILEEPALRTLFREFLKNNFCEENLSFWLDVQDFKRRFHTTSSAVAVRATWDKNDDDRLVTKRERADKDALSAHSGSSQGGVAHGLSNVVRRLGNKALGPSNLAAGVPTSSNAPQHGLNAMEKHQQDLITMALVIYNTYLAPSSPCELNIEHNLRTELVGYMKRVLSNDAGARTGLGGKELELERRLAGLQLEGGPGSDANGTGSGAGNGGAGATGATGPGPSAAAAAAARSAGNRPEFGSPSDMNGSSPASNPIGLPNVALGPSGRSGLSAAAAAASAAATAGGNSPYGPATLHASQLQTMVRLYERIQDHIFRLMATDSVPRFIKDARFQSLVRNVEEYSVALETSRSGGIAEIGLGGSGSYIGPEDENAAWANVTAQAGPGGVHPDFQVRAAGTGSGAGVGANVS